MVNANIVIVGGGIIGLATALTLAKAGFQHIKLIEQHDFPGLNQDTERPFSIRVSAITAANIEFFKQIGLWERLPKTRLAPIDSMEVWEEQNKPMYFQASLARVPSLGYIIENDVIVSELIHCVREQDAIELWTSSQLSQIVPTTEGYILHFADGKTLSASLVIAADGANSWVRQQLNIAVSSHDYGQTAIVANLACEKSHEFIARQRFSNTSICGLLPLANPKQISIVWSVDNAKREQLLALAPNRFSETLAEHMHHCLGQLELVSDRAHFPLVSKRANYYSKAHLALVGDAARSVHPLAGQGVNLGFTDVSLLAKTLIKAKQEQRDISAAYILKQYERAAKANARQFLNVIDGLFHLFKAEFPIIKQIRQTGFQKIAGCEPALAWLARQAMGLQTL